MGREGARVATPFGSALTGFGPARCLASESDAWASAALKVRSNILVLAHGGPIAEPVDAEYIMKWTKVCHGFYGASSMERLPVETALTEQVRRFKTIGRK